MGPGNAMQDAGIRATEAGIWDDGGDGFAPRRRAARGPNPATDVTMKPTADPAIEATVDILADLAQSQYILARVNFFAYYL